MAERATKLRAIDATKLRAIDAIVAVLSPELTASNLAALRAWADENRRALDERSLCR